MIRRVAIGPLIVAAFLSIAACSSNGNVEPVDGVHVIATTSILGDVVGRLGGTGIDLDVMIPPGVDPHDFSPSAQQVAALSSADLIVANGLGLEEGLADLLAQAQSEGITVLEAGADVDPLPLMGAGGEQGGFDPHFWQDPIRMRAAVEMISMLLVDAGVPDAADNAAEYEAEIDATHSEIVALIDPIPSDERLLVTNHDAFEYFADRYGFKVIGTIIPGGSTLAEPSSAEMAELVATINAYDVPAIFVENTSSSGLADTLANETGRDIKVIQLVSDALGEPGTETGTYLGMILFNANLIANSLRG